MGRIIGIDFGRKRTGLAMTDPLCYFAQGLETLPTHLVVDYLKKFHAEYTIDAIVIGMPMTLKNEASESTQYLNPFLKNLVKNFPGIEIYQIDERFTSKLAFDTMLQAGLKKKARQNKSLVDTVSATIILQSYLEQKQNNLL